MDTLMEVDEDDSVPEEIEEQCLQCHESLVATDGLLKPVLSVGRAQLEEKLDQLDSASLILLLAFTMNSLFWVYLCTQGVSPKAHPIKKELERLQKAMVRAKVLSEKKKGAQPRIDQGAAKRFVRGALRGTECDGGRKRQLEEGEKAPQSKRPATNQN